VLQVRFIQLINSLSLEPEIMSIKRNPTRARSSGLVVEEKPREVIKWKCTHKSRRGRSWHTNIIVFAHFIAFHIKRPR